MLKPRSLLSKLARVAWILLFSLPSLGLIAPPIAAALPHNLPTPHDMTLARNGNSYLNPTDYRGGSTSFKPTAAYRSLFSPKSKTLKYAGDHVIVKFKGSALPSRNSVVNRYDSHLINRIAETHSFTTKVPNGESVSGLLKELNNDPAVDYAERDYKVVPMAGQQTSWGYDTIDAAGAHTTNSATGLTGNRLNNANPVVVAVVDTGTDYNHEDLSSNIWNNSAEIAGNGVDDDGNGYIDDTMGWDFAGNTIFSAAEDNNPMDETGHGTHVSGIIAAENNSIGTVGVAPSAQIMPLKIYDDSGYANDSWTSTVSEAFHYAADNGADIISFSSGGPFPSNTLKAAVDYATSNGVLVVAAAGNSGAGSNVFKSFPAVYSNVVSVGATDENDNLASFSTWGKTDVVAPGVDIMSTIPGNRYTQYSGTSMATPFVSGEAALIKQVNPTFGTAELRHYLETTSTDEYRTGNDIFSGNGLINALTATGNLSASSTRMDLSADNFRIIADNGGFQQDSAVITAEILDSSGNPVVGQNVTFSVTQCGQGDPGDCGLTATTVATNGSGIATTTLTADNVDGTAKISADAASYGTKQIETTLYNDKVYVESLSVFREDTSSTDESIDPGTDTPARPAKFAAGDNVQVDAFLLQRWQLDFDIYPIRKADLHYVLKDSGDNTVLSGDKNNVSVSPYNQYVPINFTLPDDTIDGQYTLTVTATDQTTGDSNHKTDSLATSFNVGGDNHILIVPSDLGAYLSSYGADYFGDLLFPPDVPLTPITSALDGAGEDYDIWPYSDMPTADELKQYPVVIYAYGATGSDNEVKDYLDAGGNAYVSSTLGGFCYDNTYSSDELYFDCVGNVYGARTVSGASGGIFDGLDFNIDAFDLNGDGLRNQLFADEFSPKAGADEALDYNTGTNSPAIAGTNIDTGTYRLVTTGFGLEGVNDNLGASDTRSTMLEAILNYLRPASITVDSASPMVIDKGKVNTITVTGTNFSMTGTTTVTLGGVALDNVTVQDRNTLTADVPANYPTVGTKSLTVTDPWGNSDSLSGFTVQYAKPKIIDVTPGYGSNDKNRKITVDGQYFRPGADILIDNQKIDTTFQTTHKLTAIVPKGQALGHYDVEVKNPDGRHSRLISAYRVRYGFTYRLELGDTDPAVQFLERRLHSGGYLPGGATIDHHFDQDTFNGLRNLQKDKKLKVTGVLDKTTRAYLNDH